MKTTNIRFLNYPIRKIKFMIEDLNIYEIYLQCMKGTHEMKIKDVAQGLIHVINSS
jgi:hypothetical protein